MSSSPLPTTSGGAHIFPSPPRPRHRRCCQVIVAAAAPPRSYGVGRRAVSLAGVAAWLATTVGRKCYFAVLFYVSTHRLVCYSAVRHVRLCLWLIYCAPNSQLLQGQTRPVHLTSTSRGTKLCPAFSSGKIFRIGLLQVVAFDLHNTLLPLVACCPWTATVRKKLEPLETYVPAVLLTIDQFVDLGNARVGWSVSHGINLSVASATLSWCKIKCIIFCTIISKYELCLSLRVPITIN
jgi:hypothetical protein